MAENNKIPTNVLPGFMELLPAEQLAFDAMKATIQSVYEQYGFIALDTPVIERAEVLASKAGGETEKQIYQFKKGDNELALRFDLTVPLARYVAENWRTLAFPFRRYAIGKSYRGESPQKGRFREFYQCDIDIIGKETLSFMNDAEIISVVNAVFTKLNIGAFVVRVSNRKLITGLTEYLTIGENAVEVCRIIDKIDKIGKEEVIEEFKKIDVPDVSCKELVQFIETKGSSREIIQFLETMSVKIKNKTFEQGVKEISEVARYLDVLGVPAENVAIDLSLMRGLDYYTGTVYETVLRDYPQFGSVCGGGRYDNLAEKFTDTKLPGVGVSIGLTRLFSQLKNAGLIKFGAATKTKVLIVPLVADMSVPLRIASDLRAQNIPTEIYFEDEKIKTKLAYANKLSIPYVLMVGEDEIKSGEFTLKNMTSGEQVKVALEAISAALKD